MTSDVLQASYKLVEKPIEEKPLTAAQEQQKATRAQAVVQGITPAQPAPMKAEAAQPSMFGKLVSWFKSLSEEEQPKAKPAASKPRNAPRPERGERGERPEGGGKRRDRGGRGERGEKGERGEGGSNRERNEPRGGQKPVPAETRPQEPRQPKQPRPPRVAEEKPVLESTLAAAAVEQAEAGGPAKEGARRRGRRGGRREREHRENAAQSTAALATNGEAVVVQPAFEQSATAPAAANPTEYIAFPDGYVKPSEYIAMPTIFTPSMPAVVAPSLPAVIAPSLPAVVAKAPAVAQTSGNGLIQIETDPVKLSTVAQVTATPKERHTPRRRERQREVYVESEPLVQIETQRTQS